MALAAPCAGCWGAARCLTGRLASSSSSSSSSRAPAPCAAAARARPGGRRCAMRCRAEGTGGEGRAEGRAESREFYDYKDMPPLPLTVSEIRIPQLGYTVVDKACEPQRMASLAIFYDIYKDDQYKATLNRKSAITALCMYDRDDVEEAQRSPGAFPNIDLLQQVYNEGLELEFQVLEQK